MKHRTCTELFLKSSHLLINYHHQVISVFVLSSISLLSGRAKEQKQLNRVHSWTHMLNSKQIKVTKHIKVELIE